MRIRPLLSFVIFSLFFIGCSPQLAYWLANTDQGWKEYEKTSYKEANINLLHAANRAKLHLGPEKASEGLYNLGVFYRNQYEVGKALQYLPESLRLEETLTGPASQRTGRRLAAIGLTYVIDFNLDEGRPYIQRLRPMVGLYGGAEQTLLVELISLYDLTPEQLKEEFHKNPTRLPEILDRDIQFAYEYPTTSCSSKAEDEFTRLRHLADKDDGEAEFKLAQM